MSFPANSKYAKEIGVAVSAVLKACDVAQATFQHLVNDETVTKKDKSPVTVADYAAQALISTLLAEYFPQDLLIGEEDANDLRTAEQEGVKNKIVELADHALAKQSGSAEDSEYWRKITSRNTDQWLAAIDRGNARFSNAGRVWALDPIDGTKGFLRGGQYAICLALLEHGKPVVGVMGTPNLPQSVSELDAGRGLIFLSAKDEGAYQRPFGETQYTRIEMAKIQSLAEASFCESVEAGHTSKPLNARIAQLCGITKPPVCMDSQAKYCSIARGDGHVYLRLPVQAGYEEKIWDHASGALLVSEAGGTVSDMNGKPLDFSLGRTLAGNKGIVAAPSHLHADVISAVKQALAEDAGGKL